MLERCVEERVLLRLDRDSDVAEAQSHHSDMLRSSLRAPADAYCVERQRCGHNVSCEVGHSIKCQLWSLVSCLSTRGYSRVLSEMWLESRCCFARARARARACASLAYLLALLHVIHRLSIFRDRCRTLENGDPARASCFWPELCASSFGASSYHSFPRPRQGLTRRDTRKKGAY